MRQDKASFGPGDFGLRLLATSDLHMQLTAWDYVKDRPTAAGGLTRVASLIEAARKEAADAGWPVLLFDNGDGLQGAGPDQVAGRPHPLMAAFAALGYDAIGLGNHDFDRGLSGLEDVLAQAPAPVLCANLHPLRPGLLQRVQATTVLTRSLADGQAPVRIGVLSVLPPQTLHWNAELLTGAVEIADMVETARAKVAGLRRDGCDVVVMLAHSGLGEERHQAGQENALIPLAGAAGPDAIIGGHSHLPYSGTLSCRPVAIPGPRGRHLVQIDLGLTRSNGGWSVSSAGATLRDACAAVPPHAGLSRVLAGAHDTARARLARPVAHLQTRLHSFFSLVHPDPLSHLIAEAQAACVRPLLTGTPAEGLPLISAVAPGRAGGRGGPSNYTDVPAGRVLTRHVEDMVCFDNQLRVAVVDTAQLADWMEMAAGVFCQQTPGLHGQALADPDWPAHGFDMFFGLDYEIDLSQPARFAQDGSLAHARARRIVLHRSPGPVCAVVTTDYRVNGGGNVRALCKAASLTLRTPSLRTAVSTHLRQGPAPVYAPSPWRFRSLGGTVVHHQTAPGAAALLDEVAGFHPRPTGIDRTGFLGLDLSI